MGKNGIQYAVVDAFTAEPFKGNPAAVCLLEDAAKAADERWMQSVASEFNLSETAFLLRVRVALPEEEREAAESAGDGGVVEAGPGRQLEDGERVRVARGAHGLGGEEDVGDCKELVGAREERVRLHRPLCEALAAWRRRRTGRRSLFASRVGSHSNCVARLPTPLERCFTRIKHCRQPILGLGRIMGDLLESVYQCPITYKQSPIS
ncbi:uncharacterized protein [Miscanthus floridulus]|uniref:uncharacterized protein n=1 Tax=Miscanthus floridulus TaxID=154761 RepID=UPI003457A397